MCGGENVGSKRERVFVRPSVQSHLWNIDVTTFRTTRSLTTLGAPLGIPPVVPLTHRYSETPVLFEWWGFDDTGSLKSFGWRGQGGGLTILILPPVKGGTPWVWRTRGEKFSPLRLCGFVGRQSHHLEETPSVRRRGPCVHFPTSSSLMSYSCVRETGVLCLIFSVESVRE